jgi:TetR/AcrR family transcriptional repressor of nem operon
MMMIIINIREHRHKKEVVMKVSKEQAAKNRQAILDQAGRMLRERGLEGTGVVDVMAAAGFTHGGFYGHFDSKDDLMAKACQEIFDEKCQLWERRLQEGDPLSVMAAAYLTREHLQDPATGCPVVSLASDAGRLKGPVRDAFGAGLARLLEVMSSKLPGRSAKARRQKAILALATMVGTMTMARSVAQPELAEEILTATRAAYGVREPL